MYDNQRQNFIKNMTKIAKDLEEITLLDASEADIKRENGNIDGNSSMGMMLHYGSTVGKQFAKDYIMSPKFTELHNKGYIHIHDMDFVPEGTTTCMQINLEKLFEKGFSTGHGYLRTPGSIMSYAALTAVAIQASQNDFHGGQGIPFFDTYLAPGVLKTFRKEFYKTLSIIYGGNPEDVTKEEIFNHIDTIDLEKSRFGKWLFETLPEKLGSPINPRMMSYVYQVAKAETDKQTYQAMESLIHNLNTMHSRAGAQVPFSSINFGTDITPEGRMVTKNYLLAADAGLGHGETPIFPISIFRMQAGINYNPEDPNYDLFKLAMKVSAKRLFPNFSNQDATYNKQFLDPNNKDTQIAYMGKCKCSPCKTNMNPVFRGCAVC
jgi:ribonucleoside-triphosphate reductase (formate)